MGIRTIPLSLALMLLQLPAAAQESPNRAQPATPTQEAKADHAPPPELQELYLSARAGTEWLLRMNRADGRFQYGYVPCLRTPLEGDNYLHQAAAACALARAARYFKNDRAVALARQSVLTLLLETEIDPAQPNVRRTVFPNAGVNRLAAAGWLALAVYELPSPGEDLLQQAEELCHYVRSMQRRDGSLSWGDSPDDPRGEAHNPGGASPYTGPAVCALAYGLRHRPADWKLDAVRKACRYYHAHWRSHKDPALVSWHSAAYAEAYLRTKEQPFAECVNEMNDWLCTLQYRQPDPRRSLWFGGFQGWADGQARLAGPDVHAAVYMEGLVGACRVARETGDLQRFQSYKQTLTRCGLFLTTLQYNHGNTQHFQPRFREPLLGGFHPSHQDGTLRLDYTQQAVGGLVGYLAADWR